VTDPRTALADLIAKLSEDGDLSDDDLRQIHDAAVGQTNAIVVAKRWAEFAHVHDAPHLPVVTFDPDALLAYLADPQYHEVIIKGESFTEMIPPGERVPELVDASAVICCDCRRALVSDAGETPILVCPTLHGRRPRELEPVPGGAVECGRAPD